MSAQGSAVGSKTARRVPQWDALVTVGRIVRPHGLRGDVVISPETDFAEERFAAGATVWANAGGTPELLTIAAARVHAGRVIVKFEGCARIEDAEALSGRELRVPEDALQPLDEHTYYQHQLVGCDVETVRGRDGATVPVGRVARVEGGVGASLLVVAAERGEVLIPLTQAICVEVDVAAKRIRIDPPDGLLELNGGSRRSAAGSRQEDESRQ